MVKGVAIYLSLSNTIKVCYTKYNWSEHNVHVRVYGTYIEGI